MGCIEDCIYETAVGGAWLLFTLCWLVYISYYRRYTTMLHFYITPVPVAKISAALSLPLCYLLSLSPWRSTLLPIIQGIISGFNLIFLFPSLYLISIGIGLCDLARRGYDQQLGASILTPVYFIAVILVIFPIVGSILCPFFYLYEVLMLTIVINKTQHFLLDLTRELINEKLKLLRNFKSALLYYCFFSSVFYMAKFLLLVYGFKIFWLEFGYSILEIFLYGLIFWSIRPHENFGFSHELALQLEMRDISIIQAKIQDGSFHPSIKGSLISFPGDFNSMVFAKPLGVNLL